VGLRSEEREQIFTKKAYPGDIPEYLWHDDNTMVLKIKKLKELVMM
jgi:hypothetical protein